MRMQFLAKYREAGLLLIRVSLGALIIVLTGPVLLSGPGRWASFGRGIQNLGLHSHYQFWGFCGALIGCLGGALMIFGLFFRPGVLLVLAIVFTHILGFLARTRGASVGMDAVELCVILIGLLFVGPGKYSVDKN